jgi:hypothetical protein
MHFEEAYLEHIQLYLRSADPNGHLFRTLCDNWFAYRMGGSFLSKGHQPVWFNNPDPRKHQTALRKMHFISTSAEAVLQGTNAERLIKDHAVPIAVLRKILIERQPQGKAEIRDLLIQHYRLGVLTKSEDDALSAGGLRSRMPGNWCGNDPLARYSACGIEGRAISE